MTVFYTDLGFDIGAVDFNAALRGNHVYQADGAANYTLPDTTVTLGNLPITIPGFSIAVQAQLTVNWGRDSSSVVMGDGMEFDRGGAITAGTAHVILSQSSAGVDFGLAGFSASAAAYSNAMHTAGRADDRAYVTHALAGNDLVILSDFDDIFNSGAGRDLIAAGGGSDSINSGAGSDLVVAGKGDDSVQAGLGNDVLLGGAGNDSLVGGNGTDILWAGSGTDTLTGGAGPDAFLFALGDGSATITDFQAGDTIHYVGPPDSLFNLQVKQDGDDTKITFNGITVILQNFDRADFDSHAIVQHGTQALNDAVAAFLDGWNYA